MSNLNWDRSFALEQAADDADLLQELLDIFKQSCSKDLALIKSGLEAGNSDQIRAAAHSIKGAAASLGILGIRDVASAIEGDSRMGRLDAARNCYARLEALTQELMDM